MVFNDAMVAYRKLLSESSPKGLHSWADRCCWVNDMVTIIQNHKDVCFAVDWKLTDYKCREGLWEGLRE